MKDSAKDAGGVVSALQFAEQEHAEFELVQADLPGEGVGGFGVEEVDVHCWDEEGRTVGFC